MCSKSSMCKGHVWLLAWAGKPTRLDEHRKWLPPQLLHNAVQLVGQLQRKIKDICQVIMSACIYVLQATAREFLLEGHR